MAVQPMALCITIETPVFDGLITYQMSSVLQFRLQSLASEHSSCGTVGAKSIHLRCCSWLLECIAGILKHELFSCVNV